MSIVPPSVTSFLTTLAPALANHVWQSTLFAAAAGSFTLLFKHNHARVRYWLWLAASLKFLFPFALLSGLGSRLASPQPTPGQPGFTMVEEFSQPFASASAISSPALIDSHASTSQLVLSLGMAAWFAGSGALLVLWWWRWRTVRSATRHATPARGGRELEALDRLGPGGSIPLLLSCSALEPGIVGIFRPALVLPAGIAGRLTDAQLEAIMTHELTHVRRRDNLTAACHMLAQGIFWFHPLLWWIGAQLLDERERACDEEVLTGGSDPEVYAEGILKVCQFYLEAPLACVAGVTGSNLKKRIEAIMIQPITHQLQTGKKLLLAAAAAAALLAPVALGLLHPAPSRAQSSQDSPSLDSASVYIHPNTSGKAMPPFHIVAGPDGNFVGFKFSDSVFLATHAALPEMIRMAYGVQGFQIAGGPDWIKEQKYDVDVRFPKAIEDAKFWALPADEQTRRMDQRRLLLQSLLADRFRLVVHHETRQLPIYSLSIAANGPRLRDAKPGDNYPDGFKRRDGVPIGAGLWVPQSGVLLGQGVSTSMLAQHLSALFGRLIVDHTGLTGKYDFKLQYAPGEKESSALLSAIPQQLGLELTLQTGPVDMIVIDRAEPAEAVAGSSAHPTDLLRQVQAQSAPAREGVKVTAKGIADSSTPVRSRVFFKDGVAEFENVPLKTMLKVAYSIDDSQVTGGPAWVNSDLFDMTLKTANPAQGDALKSEIQQALSDQFKLAMHRELRSLPVYELLSGSNGARLTQARPDGPRGTEVLVEDGRIVGKQIKLKELVEYLQLRTGLPVVDKTGLDGVYDFTLNVPGEHRLRKLGSGNDNGNDNGNLFRALSEQLGLEMHPGNDPVEVLVIDHAEAPAGSRHEMARAQ